MDLPRKTPTDATLPGSNPVEKQLTQTFTSTEGWYKLEYPRVWEMEVIDNIPSFFDPFFGNGAVQTFCVKTGTQPMDAKMRDNFPFLNGKTLIDKMNLFLFSQQINVANTDFKVYNRDDVSYIPFEYEQEGRFFMVILMEKNNLVLLALYNSQQTPNKEEALIISNIIQSVEFID
ncbi:MAG: hypothetical protein ABUK01_15125 [Leptospirales bacterium]